MIDGSMMGAGQYTDYMWNSLGPRVGVPPHMMGNPGMMPGMMGPGYMGPNFLCGPTVDVYGQKGQHAAAAESPHEKNKNILLYGALAVAGAIGLYKGGKALRGGVGAVPELIKKGYNNAKDFIGTTLTNIKNKFKK